MIPELIPRGVLQDKLETIKDVIPRRQWLYCHVESIQNFIYHLDNIPSERTKARTAKDIYDYLFLLEDKLKEEHDYTALGKELAPHVWKISQVYRDELGFISKPFYPFLLTGLAILYFVLNFYYSTLLALITASAIGLMWTIYTQIKLKAKKVY